MTATVLVVEDTELLRRMYSDVLQDNGFRVLAAADGAEALRQLRTEVPDLILLDLVLPRASGVEVLTIIKADPRLKSIPVIILSSLGQESDMRRCFELGALDYLVKNDSRPVDVIKRIKAVLTGDGGETATEHKAFRLAVRDREADADALVAEARLSHRFWCPRCEVELLLELVPQADSEGWYEAHFVCPNCERSF